MSKERVVRATFSNGRVIERGSMSKVYTHAWLAEGTYPANDGSRGWAPREAGTWEKAGFSTSPAQAARNMESEIAGYRRDPAYTVTLTDVRAVEVIEKRSRNSDLQQLASDEASERILPQQVGEA